MNEYLPFGTKVIITWLDANGLNRPWTSIEALNDKPVEPSKVDTVGFVIQHNSQKIVVTESISDNNNVGPVLCIPIKMIIELGRLEALDYIIQ